MGDKAVNLFPDWIERGGYDDMIRAFISARHHYGLRRVKCPGCDRVSLTIHTIGQMYCEHCQGVYER